MNSVISISICFCPVLFIHLFTPIEGPMTHQNIQGGICELDGLYLSKSKLDKNVILHFTKATQTLFFPQLGTEQRLVFFKAIFIIWFLHRPAFVHLQLLLFTLRV